VSARNRCWRVWECSGRGVKLAVSETVVQLAEEAVEQVSQRGGVTITGGASSVVVRMRGG